MKYTDFDKLLERRIQLMRKVLASKSREYSRNEDKLHNFKRAGQINNEIPEKALIGMWTKHLVNVLDIIDDIERGKLPNRELLDEKICDLMNYIPLLEALIMERLDKELNSRSPSRSKV